MSLLPLHMKPGIYTEAEDGDALNRFKRGLNMRPFKGFMEKFKGRQKIIDTATFIGICRFLFSWSTLEFIKWVALGTHLKLYVTQGTAYYDITPIVSTGTLALDPFAVTISSTDVIVTDVAHGLTAGQYVNFSGATAGGGITIVGAYAVTSIIDADSYHITHSVAATSTDLTTGGAAVVFEYELEPGYEDSIVGSGWGGGGWGAGTWGTPRAVGFTQCRTWSMDKWGEDLIACPHRGAIYFWDASTGTGTRAVEITAAPDANLRILVTDENRILISFGSFDAGLGFLDPMLITWCDSEDYTNWTAAVTNSAGSKRLDRGNEIVVAIKSRGYYAIITDSTFYAMQVSGDQFIFDFKTEGDAVGAAGPNCAIDHNGTIHYFGRGQFQKYTGQLEQMPCAVHSFVFTEDAEKGFLGVNRMQSAKIFAARNKTRNELVWFYPSADSDEIDRCVGYSLDPELAEDERWWLGSLNPTAFLDENVLYEEPIGTGNDGYLYVHETSVNDGDAALSYSIETYDMEIPDSDLGGPGEFVMKVRRLMPRNSRLEGNHLMTISGRKNPGGTLISKPARLFKALMKWIPAKLRARQVSIKLESDEVDADIRLGTWRMDATPVGKR